MPHSGRAYPSSSATRGANCAPKRAEARPGATGRQVTDDRFDEVDHGAPHVVLGEDGLPAMGFAARVERGRLGHAILSRSSGADLVCERFAGEEAADLGHREVAHA